jgi:hypothetical protein
LGRRPSIQLVELKCPRCSGDIGIQSNDRAFLCRRCLVLWGQEEERLVEKSVEWIGPADQDSRYVPFWVFRMTAATPEGSIDDFHSYCRYIAFLENVKETMNRPVFLYVLAISLTVERHRLLTSREFTYTQPILLAGKPAGGLIWGPCIDEHAAAAFARVIFISTLAGEKKGSRDFVAGLTLTLGSPRLVYIPFREGENDYRGIDNIAAIPKKLLTYPPVGLTA